MNAHLLCQAKRVLWITSAVLLLVVVFGGVVWDDWFISADQKGRLAFSQGRLDEAAERFTSRDWKGVALFRDGSFKAAAGMFAGDDTAESAYNHGTALVMSGQYAAAIPRYERALQLKPEWTEAEANLALARAAAEVLTFEGGEMTGGKLAADDFVFNKSGSKSGGEKDPGEAAPATEAEMQAVWLRQVQTQPADFLRSKFAWQQAAREESKP